MWAMLGLIDPEEGCQGLIPRPELVKPLFLSFLVSFAAIIGQTASDNPKEEEVEWEVLDCATIGACS